MTDRPITPTRIIPAGAPLPARPPEPGEAPPWRTPPPAPPAPPAAPPPPPPAPWPPTPPPPGPIEVHVTVLPVPVDPEPTRWERITAWVGQYARPWQAIAGLALAVIPIPGTTYSSGTAWAYTVALARTEAGIPAAYVLALVPLTVIVLRIVRGGGTLLRLWGLAVTVLGLIGGALDWFDVVTIITGVHR